MGPRAVPGLRDADHPDRAQADGAAPLREGPGMSLREPGMYLQLLEHLHSLLPRLPKELR